MFRPQKTSKVASYWKKQWEHRFSVPCFPSCAPRVGYKPEDSQQRQKITQHWKVYSQQQVGPSQAPFFQHSTFLLDPAECAEAQGQAGRHQGNTAAQYQERCFSNACYSSQEEKFYDFIQKLKQETSTKSKALRTEVLGILQYLMGVSFTGIKPLN